MPGNPKQQAKKQKKEFVKGWRAPKGMRDVLPQERPYWDRIDAATRELASFYNFGLIETTTLEFADLYKKTTGEETDVVLKEMYTLKTKGGDVLALRPEYTPGICRAYLEHNMSRLGQPQKLFYNGRVFRHDRPQLGRFRQFTQLGFEVIGGQNDPIYDAQIISIFTDLVKELKIKNWVLKMNSIGCRVCRPIYKRQLQTYYRNKEKDLCAECQKRIKTNPLRLLDCKNEGCQKFKDRAPNFFDKLCATCSNHFKLVLEYLDEIQIPYSLDNQLVRGLDYYSRTVFEIFVEGPGSEVGAIAGGGRYDYLMELLGGHLTPAIGGAAGVERIIAVMKAQEIAVAPKIVRKVFLAHVGDLAKKKSLKLIKELQAAGIHIAEALSKEALKAQLKHADREGIPLALILGQKEIYEESVIIRDLRTGLQEAISIKKVVDEIKKRW